MRKRPVLAIMAILLALAAAPAGEPLQKDKPAPGDRPRSGSGYSTDQAIRFFQDRIRRDPVDSTSHAMLGHMYIRKARELNDFASYDLAEAAFREALKLYRDELPAQAGMVLVHLARHQFAEGLRLAQDLRQHHPGERMLWLLVGDAHLELGNYAKAERAYQDLQKADPQASVTSRLARLAELKGRPEEALRLMRQAAEQERSSQVTPESRAWYDMRLGEVHFQAGQLEQAGRHYEAALKDHPRYPAALTGLGRVRAAQAKYDEAIDLYKKAVAVNADVPMLAEMGDLFAKTGNEFLAKLNYDKLERAATGQAAYDRELSLFYSNHDLKLPLALELARKDFATRKDIYAHDTLAWALYKNNQPREAAKAITEALRLGTQDATLFYHAGMICKALGEKAKARGYLEKALGLNPHFSLLHADKAREALKDLGAGD